METKTESNIMTNGYNSMMTNIQLVEGIKAQRKYQEFKNTKQAKLISKLSCGDFNSKVPQFVFFYTQQAVEEPTDELSYCYEDGKEDSVDDYLKLYDEDNLDEESIESKKYWENERIMIMKGKKYLDRKQIIKMGVFNLYTFYTSSHIICIITSIIKNELTECIWRNCECYQCTLSSPKDEYFYCSRVSWEIEEVPFYMRSFEIDFFGRPCILTIDDFTQDFKTKRFWEAEEVGVINEENITSQIEKIQYMNEQNHKKHLSNQIQIEIQEKIINEQQSQIAFMQNQLQEQSKLIASLLSRLEKKEDEKVEVDMFADWLKDEVE